MNFKNHTVVVTGGTRGIGRGITEAFLKEGARVIATYARNDEEAMKLKEAYPEHLEIKKFDVSSPSEVRDFFEYMGRYEDFKILVNNSGIRKDSLVPLMPEEDFKKVLDINLQGTFLMSKYATQSFLKKRYGRIINISSVGGKLGLAGQANYAASKAGQIAFSKSLSKEVAKKGITVNNVCPGFIKTDLIGDLSPELVKSYKALVPMKRFGEVEEVAYAVLFLASEKASYISGSSLDISGGLS